MSPDSPDLDEYVRLADIILSLELSMREQDIWDKTPPTPEALASRQPFSIDTLTFPQWLQFVFIIRIKNIIEQQDSLPAKSAITPMAEEYFSQSTVHSKEIIKALSAFDRLVSQ